jgi:hypothetical protein
MAAQLSSYLKDRAVKLIELKVDCNGADPARSKLRVTDPEQVVALVKAFRGALASDDLRRGAQVHSPLVTFQIRFVVDEGPDVNLHAVGLNIFIATLGDSEAVSLESPALTDCFASYEDRLYAAATRPASPTR